MDVVRRSLARLPALGRLFHCPNGGKRGRVEAAILSGMGVRPGISDLLLLVPRRGYLGLAMELKRPGELADTSPEQKAFLREQADDGWFACVVDDAEIAFRLLEWYASGTRHFEAPEPPPGPMRAIIYGRQPPPGYVA
jgi:hypothetical protein